MLMLERARKNHLKISPETGFTIVELLVVIVVIGILASITIVSYNGVTARANTVSAQSAARAVVQKAEVYNAETGHYPTSTDDLTDDSTQVYYLSPTSVTFNALTAQPTGPNTVKFLKCGTTINTSQAALVAGNITGLKIYYWSYSDGNASSYVTAGADTGSGIACPAT